MKFVFPRPAFLTTVIVVSFFLCGYSKPTLKDIETAVLKGDYKTSEQLAKEFVDLKPLKTELDEGLYFLGLSQLRLEEYEQARKTFNLLLSGFPKENLRDKSYLGYVDALYMDGKYEGALKIAEELLAKSPHSEFLSLIYLKLARTNLKLARWEKAQGYLKQILAQYPKSLEAYSAKQLLEEKQFFAVQVGAFLDRGLAEKLAQEIQSKGEYVYIVETVDRDGRNFYRVRVGKLTLLEDAQKLQTKLTQLGYPASIYP